MAARSDPDYFIPQVTICGMLNNWLQYSTYSTTESSQTLLQQPAGEWVYRLFKQGHWFMSSDCLFGSCLHVEFELTGQN